MNMNRTLFMMIFSLASFSVYSATPENSNQANYDSTQSVKTQSSAVERDRVIDREDERKILEKDNTGLNKEKAITAETQARGTDADVEVTRKLRERLMADDQLSTNAHNIKIVTVKDAITLQGPVANKAEKVKIENMARSMAGKKKVYNRLTY